MTDEYEDDILLSTKKKEEKLRYDLERFGVEQIFYSSWYNNDAQKDYFYTINTIADIIGAALIGFLPYRNSNEYDRLSTISVNQTKEKFGEARVYCSLGELSLIYRKYNSYNSNNKIDENKHLEEQEDKVKLFAKESLIADKKHYRSVYMDFWKLFPQYRKSIMYGADWIEYIYPTKEQYEEHYYSFHVSRIDKALANCEEDKKNYLVEQKNMFIENRIDVYNICGWKL